jgi:site-specific recombinase XerD
MASVFKRGVDKGVKGSCYYVAWSDVSGKRRMRKAFRDKGLSEQLAAKLENEVMLRKRGLIDPEIDRLDESGRSPIDQHLAAYRKALSNRGTTAKHVNMTLNRLKFMLAGCKVGKLKDINRDIVSDFLHGLRTREKKPIGPRTFNHYVQTLDGFCRWLMATNRMNRNPIVGVERLNAEVEVRHRRRSLTPEEMGKLINAAAKSNKKVQQYSGELRSKLYVFSYLTGLRRKELASLTPGSFDLNAQPPNVVVDAACSKHRKRDVLPLHPQLVALLAEWLPSLGDEEKLFPKLERKKTWFMVKKDLERAGIPYETADGFADFHAAGRHSHITGLLRSGATLTQARELARHGDIRMTMRYTHIGIDDQAAALSGLSVPASSAQAQPATPRQRLSSAPAVPSSQNVTSGGDSGLSVSANENPCRDKGYREKSPSDSDRQQWRRRDANGTFLEWPAGLERRYSAVGRAQLRSIAPFPWPSHVRCRNGEQAETAHGLRMNSAWFV